MKKTALLLCILSGMPLLANAGISIDINSPGVTIHLGDRDNRGYYWDGYDWRAPSWWHAHKGHHIGERGPRGDYWNGNGWQPHAPEHHRQPQHNAPRPQHDAPHPQQAALHQNPGSQGKSGDHASRDHSDHHQPVPQQQQHR